MARFKLVSEMEKNGMRGLFNGFDQNGNAKYYKFKTSHIRREKHVRRKKAKFKVKGFEDCTHSQEDFNKIIQSSCLEANLFLKGKNV